HHIEQRRATGWSQVLPVEAHPDDAAPPRNLRDRLVGELTIAGDQGSRVAVRGHDRPAPQGERVRHSLVGHVTEIEDDVLAPHRLEQLMPELGQRSGRAGATAVPSLAPCRADDPNPAFGPRAELGGGQLLKAMRRKYVILDLRHMADEAEADAFALW